MNENRPINLDLTTIKFPPMAIASILHRISGVVLFVLMPILLYFLSLSLASEESFQHAQLLLTHIIWKLVFWVFLTALMYHLLAGVRHIIMDLGYGEELRSGRQSALTVIILSVILSIIMGIWIW